MRSPPVVGMASLGCREIAGVELSEMAQFVWCGDDLPWGRSVARVDVVAPFGTCYWSLVRCVGYQL